MAGIEVTDCSQAFVIAAGECRTRAGASGSLQYAGVQPQAEIRHGFGFIDAFSGKEFGRGAAKNILRRCHDSLILWGRASNVEEHEQDARWADADEVAKIAEHTRRTINSRQLTIQQLWNQSALGAAMWCRSARISKKLFQDRWAAKLTHIWCHQPVCNLIHRSPRAFTMLSSFYKVKARLLLDRENEFAHTCAN